jgi:hypothetical protein
MIFVRKAATAISERVVQRASPGCREWAEGLAREVEFIESDWRALVWALGSVRVLFRNPPTSLRNAAEIARAGRLFAGSREHVPPVFPLLFTMQALNYGLRAIYPLHRDDHLARAGFAIAAVSAAYLAAVGWMGGRMSKRPEDMDDAAWIEFYRREMVRLRDLFIRFGALFVPALVLMFAGMALGCGMAQPYLAFCAIAFCLFLAWLNPRPAETFQRKIDDVDSILQQGEAAAL